MRQTKLTKAMALMLSLVMITSVFVGNTLSRYVTSVNSTDSARVAIWGINGAETTMNLFSTEYIVDGKKVALSRNSDKIIAPGTSGEAPFSIINIDDTIAPEVAYKVEINFDDSQINQKIKDNPSIQWKLDDGTWGTLDALKTSILSLSGSPNGSYTYGPGEFATAFKGTQTHKIAWQWLMDNSNNIMDTEMGNLALTGDLEAVIKVSITAKQTDDLVTNEYILSGANQIVDLDDVQPLTIKSSAPLGTFSSIKINGAVLNPSNYETSGDSTIVTLKDSYLSTLSVGTYTIDIVSTDIVASTKFTVKGGPIVRNGVIPEGGTYYIGVEEDSPIGDYTGATQILTAGDNFPSIPSYGDVYVEGDYEYRYNLKNDSYRWENNSSQNGWGVSLLYDKLHPGNGKEEYGIIISEIASKPITNMDYTFAYCQTMVIAPVIPKTVTSMYNTFFMDSALVKAPIIPENVTNMYASFSDCSSLTGTIKINANPTIYDYCFDNVDFEAQGITLIGTSTKLNELGATGNNYSS